MTSTPRFRFTAFLLSLAACLPALPVAASEADQFLHKLRSELAGAGQHCEPLPHELLCNNGRIATYASSAPATLSAARKQGERAFCGKYASQQIEKGFFEGKAFKEVRVLSSSITGTGALVCVISYKR